MKNQLPILLLVALIMSSRMVISQTHDPNYYLIEEIDLDLLNDSDKRLINRSLERYHGATKDIDRANAINDIVEQCYDESLWPRYNVVLKEFVSDALTKKQNAADKVALKICLADAINNEGVIYDQRGELKNAMDAYLRAQKMYRSANYASGEATSLNNMGSIYLTVGNTSSAIDCFERSLAIRRELNDEMKVANSLGNLGNIAIVKSDYPKAKRYLSEALEIHRGLGNKKGIGAMLLQLGDVELMNGNYSAARNLLRQSRKINLELGYTEAYANAGVGLAKIERRQGEYENSIRYLHESRDLADLMGFARLRSHVSETLIPIYEALGKYHEANKEYKIFFDLQDSLKNMESQQMAIEEEVKFKFSEQMIRDSIRNAQHQEVLNLEIKGQQAEIEKNRTERIALIIGLFFLMFAIVATILSLRRKQKTNREIYAQKDLIEKEKRSADKLLLNILPEETAEELKINGSCTPKPYESVTVLFVDIHGFTRIAEQMSATELVSEINYCFTEFDVIVDKYGIEKIKTIGDAYMAAGGLPSVDPDHAVKSVKAALEMRDFMLKYKAVRISQGLPYFEARIGLHSGPVVAGIVGRKKFAYDIWGDTVNTAARIESAGVPNAVNISQTTYQLIKQDFKFIDRGEICVKNKGPINMYFVERIPEKKLLHSEEFQVKSA